MLTSLQTIGKVDGCGSTYDDLKQEDQGLGLGTQKVLETQTQTRSLVQHQE